MSKFGWSYPPGCSGPPDDEGPCMVCGKNENDCICPECPECGDVGNPDCYVDHGLVKTEEQIKSLEEAEARWAQDASEQAQGLAELEADNKKYEH